MHMEIPEKQQAEALQQVAIIGAKRAEALATVDQLTIELREASLKAARQGAGRSRIRELAKISQSTLYQWLDAAGIEVQPRRPRKAA